MPSLFFQTQLMLSVSIKQQRHRMHSCPLHSAAKQNEFRVFTQNCRSWHSVDNKFTIIISNTIIPVLIVTLQDDTLDWFVDVNSAGHYSSCWLTVIISTTFYMLRSYTRILQSAFWQNAKLTLDPPSRTNASARWTSSSPSLDRCCWRPTWRPEG